MEYNNNTYITILTTDCESFGIGENSRKSNDGTLTILEFTYGEEIPLYLQNKIINTYTHQQAIELVDTSEWIITKNFNAL